MHTKAEETPATAPRGSLVLGESFSRTPDALLQPLAGIPTSVLADADRAVYALGGPLRASSSATSFVGTALTVGAGSMAHWKALDLAVAGDVIVICSGDRRDCSEFGAVFVGIAKARGVAAIVTDGLLRDAEEIEHLGLPVFACGNHPFSPFDPAEGSVGLPVLLSGVPIEPGDVVAGDRDGIVVLPAGKLAYLAERVSRQVERESALQQAAGLGGALPEKLLAGLARIPTRPATAGGSKT